MYEALRKGADVQTLYERTFIKPWFIQQMKELVELEEEILKHRGGLPPDELLRAGQEGRLRRPVPGEAAGGHGAGDPRAAQGAGRGRRLARRAGQRRGERGLLLLELQRARHDRGLRPAQDHGAGRRTQPHRPGHRVRLLLRPRRLRPPRRGLRVDHGQLQPGDRLDRLRHVEQALLRAADGRRRAEHLREGEAARG